MAGTPASGTAGDWAAAISTQLSILVQIWARQGGALRPARLGPDDIDDEGGEAGQKHAQQDKRGPGARALVGVGTDPHRFGYETFGVGPCDPLDHRQCAVAYAGRIVAVAKGRQHLIVHDLLGDFVIGGGIARAKLDPGFTVAAQDHHHEAVIAALVAYAPIVEQPGGEGFQPALAAMAAAVLDGDHGALDPGIGMKRDQRLIEDAGVVIRQQTGEIVDRGIVPVRQ